jgi:hypothetical protein
MTNTPPNSKPRTATSKKPKTIANLHAQAQRINAAIRKEANAEKARQAKRAATIAKRQAAVQKRHYEIGTLVRKTYLKNPEIAGLVTQHLTPKNAKAAATAFGSAAFARAGRNKLELLQSNVQRYQSLWRAWFKGLTPKQRKNLTRNVYHAMSTYPGDLNPLLYGTRGLALPLPKNVKKVTTSELARRRPNQPNFPNNAKGWTIQRWHAEGVKRNKLIQRHWNRWEGSQQALYDLSRPEVNAILRRYGLPFSMANARRNLIAALGQNRLELNRWLTLSHGNERRHVPLKKSFRAALE